MSLKKLSFLSAIALALTMTLTACGSSDDNAKDEEKADQAAQTQENNEATSEETAERELLAGAPLQDGTYTLTEKDFDDHGWKAEMSIVVEDGKIKESTFDYVNADGVKKSEDEAYQEKMAEKTGVGPADFVPQLNAALVEVQNPLDVDVVTGATSSSQQFLNYAQQLVQAAQAGDTTPIEIDTKAPLQDGEYKLTEKNIGATGWRVEMAIKVEDGKITESNFDYLNENGEYKSEDEEYQAKMSEKTGVGPADFTPALNEALVETQNPAEVEVVTGATSTSYTFKVYAAQLVNAAQKGDTTPIEVDNLVFAKE